jgi:hypothetical protein
MAKTTKPNVPSWLDLQNAKARRDDLSKKLADMESKGNKETPAYQEVKKNYEQADKYFTDVETKIKKYLAEKQDVKLNKEQQKLKAERDDAIRREDFNKAREVSKDLPQPLPVGTFTPKTGPNVIAKPGAKPVATPTATPAATGTGGPKITPKKKAETPPAPDKTKPATIDEIFALVQSEYGPIDAIFKEDKDLTALMKRAVGDPKDPTDDYDPQRFLNELQTTTWFASNAGPIRQRQFYKRQYEDLLKKGGNAEELAKTTEYGRGLASAKQAIADAGVVYGSSVNSTDLDVLAGQIYDLANEGNAPIIKAAIRAKISYKPGAILGGEAGVNLAELQKTASANGLNLEKQFGSSLQGWLQKIAQGESTETYKQIIRDTAKIGLPDRVASLVDKGIDLETIYNPYRNMMAATLEVNPETIKLNDPTLRMAIGPEKEMSLYDYQRSLRKDARWQYTDNARQEVSSIAKTVLKDFGFQG